MKWTRTAVGEYETHVGGRRLLVWAFGPRQWRHNGMGIMEPHFRTMREAKAAAAR